MNAYKPHLLACVVLLAVAAIFIASRSKPATAVAPSPKTAEAAHFALFRAAPKAATTATSTETDKISRAIAFAASGDVMQPDDLKLALSKDGLKLHGVLTDKQLCLAVRESNGGGSFNCAFLPPGNAPADARKPIFALDTLVDGTFRVSGLIPDAFTGAAVSSSQGRVNGVIANNAFSVTTKDSPTALILTSASGPETYPLNVGEPGR
jgi:hypothetical protein